MTDVVPTSSTLATSMRASTSPEETSPPASPTPPAASTNLTSQNPSAALSATATDTPKTKSLRRVLKPRRRPARPQVDPATLLTAGAPPPQTGTIFNIWYNKWSGGDREDKYLSKHAATSRCAVGGDSGYTRADSVAGSYFCLFFARGLCPKGHECEYLHRLPTLHDHFNPNIDCFGRDKYSDYRDDMGGVGSFMRQNRTLYVGRIHVSDDVEEIVARHFAEWGQVERIRVLSSRGVAFITYTNEASAQFAKEAMAHQALDHAEILNVRWATVDPNPLAAKREARAVEEQAAEAVRRALPEDFVRELEGGGRGKRPRGEVFGLEGYQAPDEIVYARGLPAAEEQLAQIEQALETATAGVGSATARTPREEGGILSGGALDALQKFRQESGGKTSARPAQAGSSGGLLVGYGSDDESD